MGIRGRCLQVPLMEKSQRGDESRGVGVGGHNFIFRLSIIFSQ